MLKKELEDKLEEIKLDLQDKSDELLGLKEIYAGGITKNELRWVWVKGGVMGCVLGLIIGAMFL